MTGAQRVAQAFHDEYERLAPAYGRAESLEPIPWGDLPRQRRALLVDTFDALIDRGVLTVAERQ